ncbi:transcriptional regulator [Pseudomonas oligotrophica]|uniref:transcriptional regulator n=1 Tax=Pseudomonas oligotrophica TaxID=2912055 RepID=UPI001F1E38F2|nr:transcriptional regulator [Pseudomonas oligotrophica]MCF7200559.1 transcriptional regulator [Pseudomonas oligotrophica]
MSIPRQVTRPNHSARTLARGLGWLSLGLGVVQLLAPRQVTRFIGMPGSETMVRACGLREIATGVGILLSDDPRPWIYGRIGGDALDLAGLGWSIERGDQPAGAALAAGAVAGLTALDVSCARGLDAERVPSIEWDYSDRSGFPEPPTAMRGKAEAELTSARAEPNGFPPVLH